MWKRNFLFLSSRSTDAKSEQTNIISYIVHFFMIMKRGHRRLTIHPRRKRFEIFDSPFSLRTFTGQFKEEQDSSLTRNDCYDTCDRAFDGIIIEK